jgi:hypothetical protein
VASLTMARDQQDDPTPLGLSEHNRVQRELRDRFGEHVAWGAPGRTPFQRVALELVSQLNLC